MAQDKHPDVSNQPMANTMWGGRFAAGPAAVMEEINASIDFDKRMAAEDIAGSRAHAAMLARQGIITQEDQVAIDAGLDQVWEEITDGRFTFSRALEDIHMNLEARLREIAGDAGARLHTGRSRNDQAAVDVRMWVRARCDEVDAALGRLIGAFVAQAEAYPDLVMPGFTHLQT
ncbi:MAG: lyase family protein, partial [Pseudomonadota bacterium]